jgi:hypothetical protein
MIQARRVIAVAQTGHSLTAKHQRFHELLPLRSVNERGDGEQPVHFHRAAGGGAGGHLGWPSQPPQPRRGKVLTTGLGCCRGLTISRISVALRAVSTQNLGKWQIPLHQGSSAFGRDLSRSAYAFPSCIPHSACEPVLHGAKGTALRADVSFTGFDGGDQKSPMKVDEISYG